MTEINLEKVIKPELVHVNVEAKNKEEVLTIACQLLEQYGYVSSAEAFKADVYQREAEGITGIGQGIAIPHGKSNSVVETTVVVMSLANAIEWETLDEEPVKVVILFVVKDTDATTTHILLLQKVAILLADEVFTQELAKAKDNQMLYQLMIHGVTEEK